MTQDLMSVLKAYPAAAIEQLTLALNHANEEISNWLAANGVSAPGNFFGLTQRKDLLDAALKRDQEVFDTAIAEIAASESGPAN